MPEVAILGKAIPKPDEPAFWVLGGVIVGALFLLRRRMEDGGAGAVANAGAVRAQAAAEFAMIASEANTELAQLTSINSLEQKRLDLAFQTSVGITPGLQARCVPWPRYLEMDAPTRATIERQIRDGALIAQPSLSGMCYTPTNRGLAGSQPRATYSRDRKLFGSGERYQGPADYAFTSGGPLPEPGINGLLETLANLYTSTRPPRASQPTDPYRTMRTPNGGVIYA